MRSQITVSGQFIDFNLSINEYLNEIEVLPFDKVFNSLFIFFSFLNFNSSVISE